MRALQVSVAHDVDTASVSYRGCANVRCRKSVKNCDCSYSEMPRWRRYYILEIQIVVPGEPPVSATLFDDLAGGLLGESADSLETRHLKEWETNYDIPEYREFMREKLEIHSANLVLVCNGNGKSLNVEAIEILARSSPDEPTRMDADGSDHDSVDELSEHEQMPPARVNITESRRERGDEGGPSGDSEHLPQQNGDGRIEAIVY